MLTYTPTPSISIDLTDDFADFAEFKECKRRGWQSIDFNVLLNTCHYGDEALHQQWPTNSNIVREIQPIQSKRKPEPTGPKLKKHNYYFTTYSLPCPAARVPVTSSRRRGTELFYILSRLLTECSCNSAIDGERVFATAYGPQEDMTLTIC